MEFLAGECNEWFGSQRPDSRVPKYIIDRLAEAPHTLPPHDVWLRRVLGMREFDVSTGAVA